MKPKYHSRILQFSAALVLTAPLAYATDFYWDSNNNASGFGSTTGTWGLDPFWSTNILGTSSTAGTLITTGDDINFGTAADGLMGAGATVGVTGAVSVHNITFGSASSPVTLSGGTSITLGGATPTITVNNAADTISSVIAGTSGLTKAGTGSLTLNGSVVNGFTGGLVIKAGTLRIDYSNYNGNQLINSSNALTIGSGGTFSLQGNNTAAAATVQTFNGTTLDAGLNNFTIAKGASATSVTANLGALTVNPGSLTTINPTSFWTATPSLTERVFITALPSPGTTAYVNAGVFYRGSANAGSARWAAVDSNGQLVGKALAGNLVAATASDPTGAFQWNTNSGGVTLSNTALSIYALVLNTGGNGQSLTLAAGGTLTLNGIVQQQSSNSVSIAQGTGTGIVIGSERNLVINMDNGGGANNGNLTINAPIANNGAGGSSVTIGSTAPAGVNPGQVIFGATNTYTGSTNITNSVLRLSNTAALNGTSGVSIGNGGTLLIQALSPTFAAQTLNLNGNGSGFYGGALFINTSGTTNWNGSVSLGSSSTVVASGGTALNIGGTINLNSFALTANILNSNTNNFSKAIAGTGGSLIKTGTGTLTLSGTSASTYTGATTINAGTLALNYTTLPTPTDLVSSSSALVLGGGTLSMIAKNSATSQTFAGTTLNSGGSAISVTPNGAGAVFVLGGITRNAGSTVLFSLPTGGQNSTYGITTSFNHAGSIMGGWATTGNDWAVTGVSGTNNVTALGSYFTYDNVSGWIGASAGATSNMTDSSGYDATYTNSITLNSLRFNASGSDSNLGVVSGQNLTIASGGILVTNNVNTKYQRIGFLNTSFITGQGQGGLTTTGSELIINQNNSSTGRLEIYSSIFGSGVSLVKSGVGFLDLKGLAATYDGATTVNGGTLQVSGGNDRLPTGTTLTINGGTFQLASVSQTVAGLAGTANGIVDNASGTDTLTVNGAGSNTFAGVIKNTTGTLNVTKSGAGTQTLTGTSTYTGGTTVSSGTLTLGNFSNTLADAGAVTVNGGTLDLGANTDTVGAVTLNSGSITSLPGLSGTGGTLTGSSYAVESGSVSAKLGGTGIVLTKTTGGIVTLSGANTYTGATNVNQGTLVVGNGTGGSLASGSALTVAGGATLAGNAGTIAGATSISATGRLAPGDGTANSIGTQTFTGTLTFAATSIFDWDINSPAGADPGIGTANGGSYDKVVNTNATQMSGISVFNVILGTGKSFSDAFWDTDKTWNNVFTGTGVASVNLKDIFTSFTYNGTALTAGLVPGEGTFSYGATGTTLSWTAVPEPTSALAGLLVTAGLLRRRRTL